MTSIEISVRGNWVKVPAIQLDGNTIVVKGRLVRIASVHDEEWLESEVSNPEVYISQLKSGVNPRADLFTFTQKPTCATPRFDYAHDLVSVAVAKVADYKTWWESLPQETRKNVRRAYKRGVTIQSKAFDDDVVRGIQEVQNETPERQGKPYPHYGKTLEQVRRDHSGFVDRSDFICAYVNEEFIGFCKVVYRGDIASILQLNSKIAHYDKRPSNALLAKAIELCSSRGMSHLVYGRFNYGNKGDSSLREFKVRNGFYEIPTPRYYVPLTTWGRVAAGMKLYRGAMAFLPAPVIAAFVAARAKWYDRKAKSNKPV